MKAIGNGVTLFVTRRWQALTISYLTDSFEIIIMPKEMFFLARLWQINSKVVFLIFALKRKEQNKRTRNKNRCEKKREVRKPIICLIHLLNCWWFAINFLWRTSPILFRFCRFSLRFNFFCRSLKIAQRFSIVNNCLKERNKTKEHEIKTGTK